MTIVLTKLQHSQIEKNSKNRLQAFQRKLYLKAKTNQDYKFYCLYDKVFRRDTLEEAYRRVKLQKGTGGTDNVTWKDIEGKEKEFIDNIKTELENRTYRANTLREVKIPKKNGKTRTLKIPTIKDRVVQMAVKLIMEPIFEADFKESSYGYRPKRGAHQAIAKLAGIMFKNIYRSEEKQIEIVSLDLKDYFNTIPQAALLKCVARRVIDKQMLKTIKMFLRAGAMHENTETRDEPRGTPQGGVISPLLANIYLDQADAYWEKKTLKSSMIRYADDVVITLEKMEQTEYEKFLEFLEDNLGLRVNKEKTKRETVQQGVDYLGFRLREKISRKHKKYLSIEPNKESMMSVRDKLREVLNWHSCLSNEEIVQKANSILKGWQQYFDNIGMGKTRNKINRFTELRMARLISRRKRYGKITWKLFDNQGLYKIYGLYRMKSLGRILG